MWRILLTVLIACTIIAGVNSELIQSVKSPDLILKETPSACCKRGTKTSCNIMARCSRKASDLWFYVAAVAARPDERIRCRLAALLETGSSRAHELLELVHTLWWSDTGLQIRNKVEARASWRP